MSRLCLIRKNCFVFRDLFLQLGKFSLQLFSFQTGKSSEAHLHNGTGLSLGQRETLHKSILRFLGRVAGADQLNYFIDMIQSDKKSFNDMRPLFGFVQIIRRGRRNVGCEPSVVKLYRRDLYKLASFRKLFKTGSPYDNGVMTQE